MKLSITHLLFLSTLTSFHVVAGEEIIGKRDGNKLYARFFDQLPAEQKGPWVVEVIEGANPEEFLIRGPNIVPGKKGYLGEETAFGGLSEPKSFPQEQFSKLFNRCKKNDGAIFYLPKSSSCPSSKKIPEQDFQIGLRDGNVIVARYFNSFPEGKRGPWAVEIIKGTNPEEFLVRGANLVPSVSGILGGETSYGGLSRPLDFPSDLMKQTFNECFKPDGAIFYIPKNVACNSDQTKKDDGGSSPVTVSVVSSFVNPFIGVPYETELEVFSPEKFPVIGPPTHFDAVVKGELYNWNVIWNVHGKVFKDKKRTIQSVGLTSTPDVNPVFNDGLGTRCVDFIYDFDPDTGKPWPGDRKCSPAYTPSNFTSAIPFKSRNHATYGTAESWDKFSNSRAFDEGVGASSASMLGEQDKVDGKFNVSWSWADIENNSENGGSLVTSFLHGMSSASRGYVFSAYTQIFNTLGYANPHAYPDDGGNYSKDAPINLSWTPQFKVSLPEKGVSNKGLVDDPKIVVGGEVSSYAQSTFYQGEQYDKTGQGQFVTVNKFGPNQNVENTFARLIANLEQQRWYIDNKLDGRKAMIMTKISCDRGNFGLPEGAETNTSLQFKHYDRRHSFMIGLMTFMHKHEWLIWDRNIKNQNLDGYNGVLGVLNLLNQKKKFGQEAYSATDLYPELISDNWETEVSYNGIDWKNHKGIDIQKDSNVLPCRTAYTKKGFWIVACIRPEKIEPTTVYIRKSISGKTQILRISPDKWQSMNPAYAMGGNIPDSEKDYFFDIMSI